MVGASAPIFLQLMETKMSNPQNGTFVEFYMEAVEFKAESEKEGRPVFREIPFVRLINAGDRNNILETKATDHYRAKYAREWKAFEANQQGAMVGTPLAQWPQITKSQVKEAEFFNIKTVEQLAEVPDSSLQRIGMGWMELRLKARNYLDAAKGMAAQSAQAAENDRLRGEIEALKASFAALQEDKPQRGRPKKEPEPA